MKISTYRGEETYSLSIFACLAWALFGNDDDSVIGDAIWNPWRKDTVWIRIKWWFKNPAHNFAFYVIGFADEDIVRIGDYPHSVFNPNGGWNHCEVLVNKDGNTERYPFISYIGWCKFYFGWRERGNFSINFTLNLK